MTDRELRIQYWKQDESLTDEQAEQLASTDKLTAGESLFIRSYRFNEAMHPILERISQTAEALERTINRLRR